ncbi:MAG: hypothetical protein K8R41_07755 [Bacteroidales bacterium]|nr:hypothetical protein [Bacteroidales bacterium]
MKDKPKNIDEFYKSKLENYKEEAGKNVWENMRLTLFWIRHKWVIGLSSIVLLLGWGSIICMNIFSSSEPATNNYPPNYSKPEIVLTNNYEEKNVAQDEEKDSSEAQDESIAYRQLSNNIDAPDFVPKTNIIEIQNENTEPTGFKLNNQNTTILNENIPLLKMYSKKYNKNIAVETDSCLLDFNRHKDVLSQVLRNQRFSVNVFAGTAFSKSDISGYNPEYLAFRNSNESDKPGWSLGVDMRLHIKNWIISSGLVYSVYRQSRSYKHSYQEYSPENSFYQYDTTWVWIFDPPNYGIPMITDIDSSWVKTYNNITIDNSGINQLKYFEIPLLVGYRFNSNMFALEINTGFSAGFLVYSKIKVPEFTNNDDIVTAQQMNHTMFNFITNAYLYYYFDSKTSLFVSPYFKQNLQSIFNKSYPVKQQYKTYGVNFGVSFRF